DYRIEDASDNTASLHRLCRIFTRSPAPVRPLLHVDGTLRYRTEDRVDILATHLETLFRPFSISNSDQNQLINDYVRNFFAAPLPPEEEPQIFITPRMVRDAISKLKPKNFF
ncbi:jg3662, partial [Pararge aegeria aegeria]